MLIFIVAPNDHGRLINIAQKQVYQVYIYALYLHSA
jgi:hypothetical protein